MNIKENLSREKEIFLGFSRKMQVACHWENCKPDTFDWDYNDWDNYAYKCAHEKPYHRHCFQSRLIQCSMMNIFLSSHSEKTNVFFCECGSMINEETVQKLLSNLPKRNPLQRILQYQEQLDLDSSAMDKLDKLMKFGQVDTKCEFLPPCSTTLQSAPPNPYLPSTPLPPVFSPRKLDFTSPFTTFFTSFHTSPETSPKSTSSFALPISSGEEKKAVIGNSTSQVSSKSKCITPTCRKAFCLTPGSSSSPSAQVKHSGRRRKQDFIDTQNLFCTEVFDDDDLLPDPRAFLKNHD